MGTVTSTLRVAIDIDGVDTVVVCGDAPGLGCWDPSVAPRMSKSDHKVWELQVEAPQGTNFKYVLLRADGAQWEENRPNRQFDKVAFDAVPHVFDRKFSQDKPAHEEEVNAIPVDPPAWASNRVWYQIYPLGFFGCPLENNHTGPISQKIVALEGWCNYLKRLGVGVVLLNPIFESDSHGYDTTDYYQIDRRLGDVEHFRRLVSTLHSMDIMVVLDGVFNHTGRNFFAFKDCIANGTSSRYAGWYHILPGTSPMGDSFRYDSWEGHPTLPRLNLDNPEVKRYIFDVGRYWLSEIGVDGWRLDVAHEISPDFWREFHRECVDVYPDVCLLGELMHGDYRHYVAPGVLHSGTNYQTSHGLWNSLNDANYYELVHALDRCSKMYKGLRLLDFVGNHDVSRLYTKLRVKSHFHLAIAALLFATKGIPCLYYGDEYGMEGRSTKEGGAGNDADVRQVPPRPEALSAHERKLFDAVAQMLAVREGYLALSQGEPCILGNTNEQLVIWRDFEARNFALLIFNCGGYTDSMLPDHVQPKLVTCPEAHGLVLRQVYGYADGNPMALKQQIIMQDGKPQAKAGLHPNSISIFVGNA